MTKFLVKEFSGLWCRMRSIRKLTTSGNGNIMLDHVVFRMQVKLRLRGHVMAIHAFEEVEAGLKGRATEESGHEASRKSHLCPPQCERGG